MLFNKVHLQGIKSGVVGLAFRKWQKASVKKGTLLKTAIGLIEIVDITTIGDTKITTNDVLKAGFESKEQLLKSLRPNDNANTYKIKVRFHSPDPRIELREQKLTDESFVNLKDQLARFDKYSKKGNWTETILLTIKYNPHLHAVGIAQLTGFEKGWLKQNIRKLKNLGLTISYKVGYELSPLGKEFVGKLSLER